MKQRTIAGLLGAWLAFVSAGIAADQKNTSSPLTWIVGGDQREEEIDKQQGVRIYVDACRWIENRFGVAGRMIRPGLIVRVGDSCPDPGLTGACVSPTNGELFLPKWDGTSLGAIAQATLATALLQLIDRSEIKSVAKSLLTNDARDFVDVRLLLTNDARDFVDVRLLVREARK